MKLTTLICLSLCTVLTSQAQNVTQLTVKPAGKQIISKHIYGHFAEHLGRCIYDGFWVDENSTIPNKGRIRLDVVEALKKIKIPNLRWPGGCLQTNTTGVTVLVHATNDQKW